LNFKYGDFYDTDDYFAIHIHKNVLLYGFHNLYYIDFPFIDNTWIKKGDKFYYVAVQHGTIPRLFHKATLTYINRVTDVRLYFVGKTVWK
jgi:hypothetical protein